MNLSNLGFTINPDSQNFPSLESFLKLQQVTNDVHAIVNNFNKTTKDFYLQVDIELKEKNNDEGNRNNESQQQNFSKMISQLEEFSKTVNENIQKLKWIIRSQENIPSKILIKEISNIDFEIGSFLSVIDEINCEELKEDIVMNFKLNRLALCNSISGLVKATQNIVNNLLPSNFNDLILLNSELIKKNVEKFVISVKCLLQEKEKADNIQYQKIYDNNNHRTSTNSSNLSFGTFGNNGTFGNSSNSSISTTDSNNSSSVPTILNSSSPHHRKALYVSNFKLFDTKVSNNSNNENKEPSKKWFLEYDYDQKDLLFNMDGKVKCGTFEALIEHLTCHDAFDSNFTNTFLLTYRSFCTSTQFMSALLKRYSLPKPKGLTELNDVNEWHEKKLKPIRLRVCNVVKSWFETFSNENDEDDKKAIEMAKDFFTRENQCDPAFLTVSKLLDKFDKGFNKRNTPTPSHEVPVPILPKSLCNICFLELDPTEIARQLTLMCSKLYNQIQPLECLKKAWSKKENSPAVNIKMMIEMSDQVTSWVAITILKENDLTKRASILEHFIYIAEKCYALNNFNTLMSILAGFNSAPIYRLKRTWDLLSSKANSILEQLSRIMNRGKNFSAYREQLHSVNPPCVPCLRIYLIDLTFIEDGNKDYLMSNDRFINFSKQNRTADIIREIQQYQNQVYCLQDVPELQNYLKESLERIENESEMYEMSLILEPKESENEKITRLLIESGFL